MDTDYQLDPDEVRRRLDETEVVGLYFPFLRRTLLVDLRTSEVDGPLVVITPMVNSVEERMRSIKKLRPRFPRPGAMMLVPWPKFLAGLERIGVLAIVQERLVSIGGESMRARFDEAVAELRRLERAQVRNAVIGEGYETLWSRGR